MQLSRGFVYNANLGLKIPRRLAYVPVRVWPPAILLPQEIEAF